MVGKQGSGKSTLSKLIAGMIEPTSGAILIDGVDVRQIDTADIRKILSNAARQLALLWIYTRKHTMGFNEYDDEHILNICKVAGVDDFVGSQPKGYDLEIKERGIGLSGGHVKQ